MVTTPRELAAQLLRQCESSRSYANLALDAALRRSQLSPADGALCAALVYGVIERRRTLDFQLNQLLKQPLVQLHAVTRAALRLGLYQLFFMERIPPHAAIHESVELVKGSKKTAHTAGLVNAVLRRAQRQGMQLPQGGSDADLGVRYACPSWLVQLWRESYPEDTIPLLEHSFGGSETILRCNPLKPQAQQLPERLQAAPVEGLPHALRLPGGGNITQLPGYAEGLFHVQDSGAQLCCEALAPQPGDTVFDLCAAPGGKSFTLAEMMHNEGRVIALELHKQRVKLIAEGARRLGLSCIEAMEGDAAGAPQSLAAYGPAQRVLCDVPCSGLGIIRKKPDIREKLRTELDNLPELQYTILCAGFRCLSQDGVLVYATCTLNPAENEALCRRFLREHPEAQALPALPEWQGLHHPEGFVTLMPHRSGTDGFFIAKFRHRTAV